MSTILPQSPAPAAFVAGSTASRSTTRPAAATEASWRLLAAGDEVSVAGAGAFQLVHISAGSAWVEGLVDRAPRLVAAASLRLIRAGAGLRHS